MRFTSSAEALSSPHPNDSDDSWILVNLNPEPHMEVAPEDIPPSPDPKEHPGGATGGLLHRVLKEMDASPKASAREREEKRRQDGLVWRIRSAL